MKLTKTESAIIMALKGMLEPFKNRFPVLFYVWGIISCIQNNDRHSLNCHVKNLYEQHDFRNNPNNSWPETE